MIQLRIPFALHPHRWHSLDTPLSNHVPAPPELVRCAEDGSEKADCSCQTKGPLYAMRRGFDNVSGAWTRCFDGSTSRFPAVTITRRATSIAATWASSFVQRLPIVRQHRVTFQPARKYDVGIKYPRSEQHRTRIHHGDW